MLFLAGAVPQAQQQRPTGGEQQRQPAIVSTLAVALGGRGAGRATSLACAVPGKSHSIPAQSAGACVRRTAGAYPPCLSLSSPSGLRVVSSRFPLLRRLPSTVPLRPPETAPDTVSAIQRHRLFLATALATRMIGPSEPSAGARYGLALPAPSADGEQGQQQARRPPERGHTPAKPHAHRLLPP